MILAAAALVPLLVLSVWLFVRGQPVTARLPALRRYNRVVAGLGVVVVCLLTLYLWATTGQSADRAWWPLLAVLGSVFVVCLLLIIATLVRLVVFRRTG